MKKSTMKLNLTKTIIISFLAIATIFALVFGISTNVAYAAEKENIIVCQNFAEIAQVTKKEYPNVAESDDYLPIGICKAKLHNSDNTTDVYIVTLLGTRFAYNKDSGWQATDIINDVLAGFDFNNPYLNVVKARIFEKIPTNSQILLFGHSLGGMIAQEVAADTDIKNNYNITNTVTFGSPLCAFNEGREGIVRRMCDKRDIIPNLSKYTLTNYQEQYYSKEVCVEDGGYGFFGIISAHCASYQRSEIWGKYDTLGFLGNNNSISFDATQMEYFPAPMFS